MRSLLVAQVKRPVFVSVEAPLFVLLGAAFTVVGLGILFAKISLFRDFLRVRSTPTSTLRAAAVGRIDIEGEGRTVDGQVRSPTQGECLVAVWEISERSGDQWDATHTGMEAEQFVLSDGTGEILVANPTRPFPHDGRETNHTPTVGHTSSSGSSVENRREYSVRYASEDDSGKTHEAVVNVSDANVVKTTVPAGESPPEGFRPVCERNGIEPVVDHERRFMELAIPDGETVYVHGQAVRADEGRGHTDTNLIVRSDDARGQFLLADRSQEEFVDLLWWRWKTVGTIGVGLLGLGLVALIAGLGGL